VNVRAASQSGRARAKDECQSSITIWPRARDGSYPRGSRPPERGFSSIKRTPHPPGARAPLPAVLPFPNTFQGRLGSDGHAPASNVCKHAQSVPVGTVSLGTPTHCGADQNMPRARMRRAHTALQTRICQERMRRAHGQLTHSPSTSWAPSARGVQLK